MNFLHVLQSFSICYTSKHEAGGIWSADMIETGKMNLQKFHTACNYATNNSLEL